MTKQSLLLIVFSLIAILFMAQLNHFLDSLVFLHNYITNTLHVIFSSDRVGRLIQDMVALLLIPFVAGGIVSLVYWLAKRSSMPYTMPFIWILWLVLLTTMVAQNDEGSVRRVAKLTDASLLHLEKHQRA